MTTTDISRLAKAISEAEMEKRAWNAGRVAFRDKGEIAINPNPPGSQQHHLWADGFAYERSRRIPQASGANGFRG